jgi:hypothetical protein
MIQVVHPGSRILTFYTSQIPDPKVKKALDPGSQIRIRSTDLKWSAHLVLSLYLSPLLGAKETAWVHYIIDLAR